MAGFFSRGLILEQHKEPALSRDLRDLTQREQRLIAQPAKDPGALSGDEIIRIARQAQIVDERDGLLLADKLEEGARLHVAMLIGDAMDDEPYVSSQLNPFFKLAQQAVGGLGYAAKAIGARETRVAVYKNIYDAQLHMPHTVYGVRIQKITGKYPIEARTRFTALDDATYLVGVCALIHLYRALHFGMQQASAFVTVAGNCVATPQNVEVSFGMTATQVLEHCGLIEEPVRVVLGGPMTGLSVEDPTTTPIGATTRAVLAFKNDAFSTHQCVGCGRCVRACPQLLSPFYLYKAARTKHIRVLRSYDALRCIGCGTCSYVCPAKLELSAAIETGAVLIRALDEKNAHPALSSEKNEETRHA